MMFKRAATFVALLAISIILFPLLAFAIAGTGLSRFSNALFFWPQYLLAPNGFHKEDVAQFQGFLFDSAIYIAVAFWLVFAAAYGYLFRNIKIRYAALATYPVVYTTIFLFIWLLDILGYDLTLDGP